jgi:uncharacterized protein YndB with AHSA1/START domain
MSSTRITCRIRAPRASVYRALIDARAIAAWTAPSGMTIQVHEFDAREGGAFRVSLTYDDPSGRGKTTPHTDTYHGRFVTLVPGELVVEAVEFETADPPMRGEMTITFALAMRRAARTSARCTTGCRRACHQPITRPGGTRPWRNPRPSSKAANYLGESRAKAMMLSSVIGFPKNPPPVEGITTYCRPSLP